MGLNGGSVATDSDLSREFFIAHLQTTLQLAGTVSPRKQAWFDFLLK